MGWQSHHCLWCAPSFLRPYYFLWFSRILKNCQNIQNLLDRREVKPRLVCLTGKTVLIMDSVDGPIVALWYLRLVAHQNTSDLGSDPACELDLNWQWNEKGRKRGDECKLRRKSPLEPTSPHSEQVFVLMCLSLTHFPRLQMAPAPSYDNCQWVEFFTVSHPWPMTLLSSNLKSQCLKFWARSEGYF